MEKQHISLSKHFWSLAASLIALLVGGWLMVAPYALGYQAYGASWSNQTQVDFWTGLGVAILSLISMAAFAASLVGDLRRLGILQTHQRVEPVQAAPAPIPVTGAVEGEFERAMTTLASALAADMAERRRSQTGQAPQPQAGTVSPEKSDKRS